MRTSHYMPSLGLPIVLALLGPGDEGAIPAHSFAACSVPSAMMTPEVVPMRPTQSAPGGRGSLTLTQPDSPFGITVDAEGRHAYMITVQVDRLRRRAGASYVVWAATPELDQFVRLGALGDSNHLDGSVAWNQFMVFISEEASPSVEEWEGPIVLTGLSPSGRMHTMAGHGPFEGMNCQQYY